MAAGQRRRHRTDPRHQTKHVTRVEENTAADRTELTAEQINRLDNLTPAAGNRREDADMRLLGR